MSAVRGYEDSIVVMFLGRGQHGSGPSPDEFRPTGPRCMGQVVEAGYEVIIELDEHLSAGHASRLHHVRGPYGLSNGPGVADQSVSLGG